MVSRDEYVTFPERFDSLIPPPCVVRILLVTDYKASFADIDFGLKELIDTLGVSPGPWVRFEVTKAHRECDRSPLLKPGVDYLPNFKFSDAALSGIDEVWLFGVATPGQGPMMDDAELAALARFMDGGGGVFATGDHEDLGNPLCARVPRVRTMRKWYWPEPGPMGEPVAPIGPAGRFNIGIEKSVLRFDTLREGHDPGYQFDDQSDTVPQEIEPKIYSNDSLNSRSYPHPLLCSPRGVIKTLPDHPHEGECYVTDDLNRTLAFGDYSTVEYPSFQGEPLKPEVIAWANVIGGHKTIGTQLEPDFPAVAGRRFGVIGAWDGHRVERGRVVVDASFHHFFQINLRGVAEGSNEEKRHGFFFTPEGLAILEDIKSYYRNIAFWLARPEQQVCMLYRGLWWARWRYPLIEELLPPVSRDLQTVRYYGRVTREILKRTGSLCVVDAWIIKLFSEAAATHYLEPLIPAGDVWYPGGQTRAEIPPGIDKEQLFNIVAGGAMIGIAEGYLLGSRIDALAAQANLKTLVSAGVNEGLQMMLSDIRNSLIDSQRFFLRLKVDEYESPLAGTKEDEMATACSGTWNNFTLFFDSNPGTKVFNGSLEVTDGPGGAITGSHNKPDGTKGGALDGKCRPLAGSSDHIITLHYVEDGLDFFLRGLVTASDPDRITGGVFITVKRLSINAAEERLEEILLEPGDTGTWQGQQGTLLKEKQEQQQYK